GYSLEYGSDVRSVAISETIGVSDGPEGVTMNTGPMRFTVSRETATLVRGVSLDLNTDGEFTPDEIISSADGAALPEMRNQQLERCCVRADDDYRVTVEQAGPLHAIIRVDGWFTAASGERLRQHVARLHAYRGHRFIHVEHTFVVGYDTEQTQLRGIIMPVPIEFGDHDIRAVFGLDGGRASKADIGSYLIQDAADHYSIHSPSHEVVAEGERAAGWMDCSTDDRGVTVGIRHVWEEYPKELSCGGSEVVAHLWPTDCQKPLDFDARAVLGPELYAQWDKVYWRNWYKGGLDQYDQAFGLAKSNDLMIAFHAGSQSQADLCHTLDEPVIVSASPEWMCSSDVMGPVHPRDPDRFPEDEAKMDLGFDRFEWLRKHLGNYGLIDYGDVNYNLTFDEEHERWLPSPWRRFASRFYGHPVMPWVQFLRSGRREHLQWGIDNARHVMDIDMAHLTNEKLAKRRGGRYGGNGGILHYAGNMYDIGCDSHVDHLLLCYYLTGYRRALDVLQEEADHYMWLDSQPGGAMHVWAHSMTGGAMRTMIALYRATWDEKYLIVAERLAELCYANQDDAGVIRHDDVYMLPGLFTYYQATGDERMRELILHCMDCQAKQGRNESDPRSFGFYGLSIAYFLTGDPSYLRWAERWRQEFLNEVQDTDDPLWRGQPKGEWDYCYLTLHLLYMPYYLEALSTLDEPVSRASRDRALTNGRMLLNRADEKPFSVAAEWFCYDSEHCIGVTLDSLDRYINRYPTTARVVLRGPSGEVMASRPIMIERRQRRGRIVIDAPHGDTGVYSLGVEKPGGLHFKLRLASTDLTGWGYATEGEYLSCADTYYFYVPDDADDFEVSVKSLALRQPVEFSVFNPAGEREWQKEIKFGSAPQGDYLTSAFTPTQQQRGKLWRICTSPSDSS
ncbi:MAG: hypothetical protein ACLFWB_13630, partial [Armatimonadota bacterium]